MSDDKHIHEKTSFPYREEQINKFNQIVKFKPLRFILGLASSVVLIWLAFRDIKIGDITIAIKNLHWGYVIFALTLSISSTYFRAVRWRILLNHDNRTVNFLRLLCILFISQMLNLLIPLRAGELTRIFLIQPISKARTLGSIIIEKFLDLLTLVAFLLILLLTLSLPEWFTESRQSLILLTLSISIILAILFLLKEKIIIFFVTLARKLPFGWEKKLEDALSSGLESLDVFKKPLISLSLQFWSFLIWGLGFMVNYVLFDALGLNLPVSAALFLLLVLQVGISIPNIPGKLGVFQYSTILTLAVFGVEKEQALTYSLILYMIGFGPHLLFGSLFGWKFWLQYRQNKKISSSL